ncbi:putative manganese-dependent inorganic diphosphatase [Sedimentibacter sp. zth1]|uniref:putative manganese-dependent inorganic diphosphatase n=1 Tax=Sedimentibacter sp. zth1 TaxID=2816908 RepID=UPI001A91F60A|nr:putative manganese-dependent inorganic diphosphatase [Sedimentibacter sp. zth1]QSX07126.1 putative manganese-dependent inorganic diphosphatase [Sedimentibacter sp. zth1]
MKFNLIFGHKVPDTDSVCAAIALAYLKNKINEKSIPYVLGNVNTETKFVLDYFNVETPKLLDNVKLQVKDLNYEKTKPLMSNVSIHYAYKYMNENTLRTLPIVDEHNKLLGVITMKNIAMSLINTDESKIEALYNNIIETLNAKQIVRVDDTIVGEIIVAAFYEKTLKHNITFNEKSIVIVGDRYDVIEYAIERKVKLIIVTGNLDIPEKYINSAKKNRVNIISSPLKSYQTTKNLCFSKSVNEIMNKNDIIMFNENEYVGECKEEIENSKHSKFPVVTKYKKYLGILSRRHLINPTRKKVILVDHNESVQSVDGLMEADILEIVDHHKIGDIRTSLPINFRNMTLGSTNTIIYQLFKENNIEIDKSVAGLMISGIISDTLMFKSPTTTQKDRETVDKLAEILGIDVYEYSMQMFKAGTSLKGKSIEEVFYQDYKEFVSDEIKVGVSQVFTLSIDEIMIKKDEYIKLINNIKSEKEFLLNIMAVTDIINEGSYIFYSTLQENIVKNIFNLVEVYQGIYVPNCVSRKKQIVPGIMNVIQYM